MHPADVVMPYSNQEFGTKVESERNSLAGLGISLAIADIYRQGYIVSIPFDKGAKYSLIVDRGVLLRVLVQVAQTTELSVKLGRISYKEDSYGSITEINEPKFTGTEFDLLAVVDRATGIVYYVPVDEIDFKKPRLYVKEADRNRFRAI